MSKIQYTIRNIPEPVDQVIRKRQQQTGKSFNQTVVDLLSLQTFGAEQPPQERGFDWLFAANTLDSSFDQAIKDISRIDGELWQ